jgi:hypothetical protein
MSHVQLLITLVVAILLVNALFATLSTFQGDPPGWLRGLTLLDGAATLAVVGAVWFSESLPMQVATLVIAGVTTVASRALSFRHYTRQQAPR